MRSILFTGDREWADAHTVRRAIAELEPGDRVIVGDDGITRPHRPPRGAGLDCLAYRAACGALDLIIDGPHVADWAKYGRGAGPVRNRVMLGRTPIDEVWAFHDDLEHSSGTKDCVTEARRRGIPVRMFHSSHDGTA